MEVNPLVFETSASTDSAIWAFGGAKIQRFFDLSSIFALFFSFYTYKKAFFCRFLTVFFL